MHPLEPFDSFRRWFGCVAPGCQPWERNPEQVAPDRSEDWLLEPPILEEACWLFPQLDEERDLLFQQVGRLERIARKAEIAGQFSAAVGAITALNRMMAVGADQKGFRGHRHNEHHHRP